MLNSKALEQLQSLKNALQAEMSPEEKKLEMWRRGFEETYIIAKVQTLEFSRPVLI